MTIIERIKQARECHDCDVDNIDKLIYLAYWIGREEAAKSVSDVYAAHIAEQKHRAAECRYHKMAAEIVGTEDYLYFPDYSQDMTAMFGSDETEL